MDQGLIHCSRVASTTHMVQKTLFRCAEPPIGARWHQPRAASAPEAVFLESTLDCAELSGSSGSLIPDSVFSVSELRLGWRSGQEAQRPSVESGPSPI